VSILPFATIISQASLSAAFDKVLRNAGGPGGDGMTVAAFARSAEARIARLSWELEAGFYRPGPLRRVAVPKRSGGMRVLSIPCVVDRVAQASAASVLTQWLEPHFEPSSFAYRPGRGVRQAVERVAALRRQGYGVVVDGDIRSFFDEVPHGMVLAKLGALVPDQRLIQLVGLWLESFSDTGRGLAQGSPISPILSNLHLDAIDEAFEGGPARIVRFADDFVLLAKSRGNAEAALERVARLLHEHGLELNRDKTRIIPFEQAFDFLGYMFVRSVMLERESEPDPPIPGETTLPVAAQALHVPREVSPEDDEEPVTVTLVTDAPEPFDEDSTPSPSGLIRRRKRNEPDPLADLTADRSEEDFAAGLAPLYVLEPGRRLAVEGEAFTVHGDGRQWIGIPAHLVGRIDLGPDVEAEDSALRLAAAHRIPVAFLDGLGQTQALLTPREGPDAALHLAQARAMLEPERALVLTRAFTAARLRNAHALLKRLNRRRKDEAVATICDRLHHIRRKAQFARDIDMARGAEGEGAQIYWPALGACLEHGFNIKRRREESGANPVNAALDFTAALLTRDMRAAILRAGLHPGFGVLHTTADNKEACVYDLVEAFRAPLAEGLTVYLFNNRIIGPGDYGPRAEGLRLSAQASRKLVQTYEAWLARPVKNPRTGCHTTWRGLLLAEARAFAKACREDGEFIPFALDF
jgi:CRISP-associated protein Cas1